jgi:hypothetical protein
MHTTALGGLTAVGASATATGTANDEIRAKGTVGDRESVLAAGMTEAEADCWELVAKTAGKYFELPELHPMDRQEIASAIHLVQNKLLSRPTYRRYLELAKAAAEK